MGAVASIALAGAAHAGGWYISAETGANLMDDVDAVGTLGGVPGSGTFTTDSGWALFGTVGHEFAKGWSLEGELGYRENSTDSGGYIDITEQSLMVNVIYDISVSPSLDLELGLGGGYDQTTFEVGGAEGDDSGFAWQGIVGANWALGSSTDLTFRYRYFNAAGPSLSAGAGVATIDFDDLTKHSLTVGLRFKMGDDAE